MGCARATLLKTPASHIPPPTPVRCVRKSASIPLRAPEKFTDSIRSFITFVWHNFIDVYKKRVRLAAPASRQLLQLATDNFTAGEQHNCQVETQKTTEKRPDIEASATARTFVGAHPDVKHGTISAAMLSLNIYRRPTIGAINRAPVII